MELTAIKDLMAQFADSSLREFSYKNGTDELVFSKNETKPVSITESTPVAAASVATQAPVMDSQSVPKVIPALAEGNEVPSPLVGVAYLSPAPDKPAFISVGDSVKKGQTLMIIEAMKVMNEIPAPHDGIVTEILVANEEVVEFGQGMVRLK